MKGKLKKTENKKTKKTKEAGDQKGHRLIAIRTD